MDALAKITAQLHSLSIKSDSVEKKLDGMASKKDLENLETSISKNTKIQIAEAVDPLKSDLYDLRQRVTGLETNGVAGASNPAGKSSTISPEIKALVDSLDPAHKRIAFSGFPLSMAQEIRRKHIEDFLRGFQNLPNTQNIGMIMKGPKNKREITRLSYVEYFSSDDVKTVLDFVKNTPLNVGGDSISVKRALTKINGSRNWALREAEKLVKAFAENISGEVKLQWQTRSVLLNDLEVFKQTTDDMKGTFSGACKDLKLP